MKLSRKRRMKEHEDLWVVMMTRGMSLPGKKKKISAGYENIL